MGFLWFGSKKSITDREKEIIKKAYEQVEKCTFETLYIKQSNAIEHKKLGFQTEKDAAEDLIKASIEQFLKNNNYLGFIIANAERWNELLKDHMDQSTSDALGAFVTIQWRLKKNDYILRKMGSIYYPEAICYEDEKKTREHILRNLEKLKRL